MSAWSLPNRKFASARASSVLPTPVGPRKIKLPVGRCGFLRPARDRRIAREIAEMAVSWLIDALVEVGFHPQQLVAFILVDGRDRHAGPLRHDLVDVSLRDDDLARARLHVELLADELQVLAGRDFLLAVELRLLEILLRDRVLHLLDRDADALVDLAELLAVAGFLQLGARAGFIRRDRSPCRAGSDP